MKTANPDLLILFKQFEDDVVFDCHSLAIKISRSDAAKQLIALGPNILKDLNIYLKDSKAPSIIIALSEEVQYAWGILLSWICEQHSLNRKGIKQNDFKSWVSWTESQSSSEV